jgi:hypothetical protein
MSISSYVLHIKNTLFCLPAKFLFRLFYPVEMVLKMLEHALAEFFLGAIL